MKVTVDKSEDIAKIYLDYIPAGGVAESCVCDAEASAAAIYLDFDKDGRLIGIEVSPASKGLPAALLSEAEVIG